MVRKHSKAVRGGAVRMPLEYFGGQSGVYSSNPNVGYEAHAYGDVVPVSYGNINGNTTGPNLHVMPNSSMLQTGGRCHNKNKSFKNKVNRFIKKVKRTLKLKKKSVRRNKNKKKSVRRNKK